MNIIGVDINDWLQQQTAEGLWSIREGKASIFLPDLLDKITYITNYFQSENANIVVFPGRRGRIELNFTGYWLFQNEQISQRIFVAQLTDRIEGYVWGLWCVANY